MFRENIAADDAVELRNSVRGEIELIRARISFLKGPEKLLMKMHLNDGYKIQEIACCAGVCESTISRKIKKISQRLTSPLFCAFFENKDMFNTFERKVIKDFLREGLTQRKISEKRNTTRYYVRKAIEKLETLVMV